ncbi:hypothetical protein WALBB_70010 [Wolbachia pipientis wAlbB]|nr:hypothetical protein WALBB_70010 [Wolbachia pipientis wAlbB]
MLHLLINALQVNIGAEINIAEQVPTAIPKEMIKLKSLTIPVQISTKGREARRVVPEVNIVRNSVELMLASTISSISTSFLFF